MEKNTTLKRKKNLTLDSLLFVTFVAGACYLHGKNQVRVLGIVFGYIFFIANAQRLNKILGYIRNMPIEIKLFFLWVIWSVLTGNFVAENYVYFSVAALRVIQMALVVLFSYFVTMDKKDPALILWGVLIGAFLQVLWIIFTYKNPLSILFINERLRAHTMNPNDLGFLMIWAGGAILFVAGNKVKSFKFAISIWSIIGYFFIVILATGSRKSFFGLLLFLFIWVIWVSPEIFKNTFVRNFISIVLILIFIFSLYSSLPFILERTIVGQRLLALIEQGTGQAIHTEHRLDMYITGIKLFLEHPIFGVGLDNFKVYYWQGVYSHSDYIETLANTGLIGFFLYQSFHFILLWKLFNLLKILPEGHRKRYRTKLLISIILIILFIGLGAPHYTSIPVFTILTAASVYAYLLKREKRINHKSL